MARATYLVVQMCTSGRFLCPRTHLSLFITSVDVSSPPSHLTPPPSSSFSTPAYPSAKHLQRPTVSQARHRGLEAEAEHNPVALGKCIL